MPPHGGTFTPPASLQEMMSLGMPPQPHHLPHHLRHEMHMSSVPLPAYPPASMPQALDVPQHMGVPTSQHMGLPTSQHMGVATSQHLGVANGQHLVPPQEKKQRPSPNNSWMVPQVAQAALNHLEPFPSPPLDAEEKLVAL